MGVVIKVLSGPDAGTQAAFSGSVIRIGRGPKNDLILNDGLVSQYHGEVVLRDWGWVHRDLRSRHGTMVKIDRVTVNLHDHDRAQEVTLVDGAELLLGESSIQISLSDTRSSQELLPASLAGDTTPGMAMHSELDDHIVARTEDSIDAVAKRLSRQDPRLMSIFKLSRNLNTTSDLNEILALIVDATFEAFPAANFFAISMVTGESSERGTPTLEPWFNRDRYFRRDTLTAPLLSHRILSEVAQSREGYLFVREDAGMDLSESIINARIMACLAAPLVGQHKLIGVMQTDTRGLGGLFGPEDLELFTVMASYAAFAIERVMLSNSIVEMFDGIVKASVTAIDARDPFTAGHSERVAKLTVILAEATNRVTDGPLGPVKLTQHQLKELRYAALLHDFGKIGVRESVLTKAERLYPENKRAIAHRFEAIKAMQVAKLHHDAMVALSESGRPVRPEDVAELDLRAKRICVELDGIRAFLLDRRQGVVLTPDDIAKIRFFAKKEYTDSTGHTRRYLEPEELEALCVRTGTLTTTEWDDMKAHAARSREFLSQIPWSDELSNIPCIAGLHHEKLDGSGYPNGISGDQISPQVRMLTISDIFDALTAADRPYKKAVSVDRAVKMLMDEARQGQLDLDLVSLFESDVVPYYEFDRPPDISGGF